ncbi:MAG: SAM-dependent methyltransferase [Gordonia sp. (in: high G+C Gram-positive bacteria)]|uniref:cobalt-precorrin-4/precorrin-4 C(11)-methyltransferase n=1 Tax=Gordonia sp. (in: high G+C Gram-positive bacteria) TaxID=84139 RepID=UPI0039E38FC1
MTVYFLGAGPGAADLITVRAARILARCRTCLYAGSLVPDEVLDLLPADAVRIDTARMPLDEIVAHLAAADAAGHDVARLHSGDLSLYSALTEQQRRLRELGIDCRLVPGVPAFAAAAAALDVELTVPGIGQSLLITRVSTLSTDMPPGEDLASLARSGVTLALHLAAHRTAQIVEALAPHYGADCPTATVAFASRADEQIVRARLADLPDALGAAGITKTAVIFVGRVLAPEASSEALESYLYSHARMRKLRTDARHAAGVPVSSDADSVDAAAHE